MVATFLMACASAGTPASALAASFPNRPAVETYTLAIDAGTWSARAVAERVLVTGTNANHLLAHASAQQHYLSVLKGVAKALAERYINHSLATNGVFTNLAPVSESIFPMWTDKDIADHLNLPTNIFMHSPWQYVSGSRHPSMEPWVESGFTETAYGWNSLVSIVQQLKWTPAVDQGVLAQRTVCNENTCLPIIGTSTNDPGPLDLLPMACANSTVECSPGEDTVLQSAFDSQVAYTGYWTYYEDHPRTAEGLVTFEG